jgi:hypothetical protein
MKSSERRMPSSLSFIAGTVVGAIAVFVPMTSAGRSGPKPATAERRPAVSAASPKQEALESKTTCDNDRCDVQLD